MSDLFAMSPLTLSPTHFSTESLTRRSSKWFTLYSIHGGYRTNFFQQHPNTLHNTAHLKFRKSATTQLPLLKSAIT
ncbi:hypothetical protein BDA96_01G498300 [Sorghum bicolor]|uniref:Uncharacterized protein n=1 Tax=Sorghum bicolor TaxID=4558 RepID=A0A921S895_SORBI|nr:hypothetical protein BDA96_01G498300 [Sorghum bicolor]